MASARRSSGCAATSRAASAFARRQPSITADAVPAEHIALKKQSPFFKTGSQVGDLAASNELFPSLVRVTGLELDDVRSSLNLGANFARVTARDPVITSIGAPFTDVDMARLAGRHTLARIFERSPAPELVRTEVERATEEVGKKVDAQLKDLNKEIDKRLSPTALGQAKVIKELKQQLDEQRDANEGLNKRLDLLEKRKQP